MQGTEKETPSVERNHGHHKKMVFRFLSLAILLLVALIIIYLVYVGIKNVSGTFTKYSVVHSVERSDGASARYEMYQGAILKYSQDGATAYNTKGDIVWTGSYNMKDPIIDLCEGYVAVADRGSKLVHIFNEKGTVGEITTEYEIQKVQVANQGVVAVMMTEGESTYIALYNGENAKKLVDMKIPYEKSGYGMDLALSNDGQKLVTSFLDVNAGTMKTNVAYYNFNDVGENYVFRLTLGSVYKDVVVPKVSFLDNDTVCVYRNDGFEMYEMEQTPNEKALAKVTFQEQILSTFSSGSYVGFVLQPKDNEAGGNRIVVYDLRGKKVMDKKLDFNYQNISMNENDIIFWNETECRILNTKGRVRFKYTFTNGADGMYGTKAANRYFLIAKNAIEVIKLRGAK